jgi:hypothetical protein
LRQRVRTSNDIWPGRKSFANGTASRSEKDQRADRQHAWGQKKMQRGYIATQVLTRGRHIKFTPERIQQIKSGGARKEPRGNCRDDRRDRWFAASHLLQVGHQSAATHCLSSGPVRCGEVNRALREVRFRRVDAPLDFERDRLASPSCLDELELAGELSPLGATLV